MQCRQSDSFAWNSQECNVCEAVMQLMCVFWVRGEVGASGLHLGLSCQPLQ